MLVKLSSRVKDLLLYFMFVVAACLLLPWEVFAQLAFDPTVGNVSADNPFKDVGEAGASIIQSVQTYLSPLIILAALIALFIMKLMNKLDWTWALRVTFVSLCLIFVNEITSWLLSFGG